MRKSQKGKNGIFYFGHSQKQSCQKKKHLDNNESYSINTFLGKKGSH